MSTLFKIFLFTAPVLAIIFYFLVLRLERIDVQQEQAAIKFEQQLTDFDEQFEAFGDPVKEAALNKKRAEARARAEVERKREATALAKLGKEVEDKEKQYIQDFEKAMQDFEREYQRRK